jgi:hypothetical protein
MAFPHFAEARPAEVCLGDCRKAGPTQKSVTVLGLLEEETVPGLFS